MSKIERMINKLPGIIDCVLISSLASLICTRGGTTKANQTRLTN